jgi:drug/metabolite transporter (DMT)-like permease
VGLQLFVLGLGVFACSTAVIMIKMCSVEPVLLSAYRLLVAAVALTPLFARDFGRHRASYSSRDLRRTVVPGILLAVHFITWIMAARMTDAANASLIVNLVPVVMPFLMIALVGERINLGEIAGTLAALVGLVILTGADYQLDREHFWGDMLCLVSMLFFATYLALARRNRQLVPTTWLYAVPLYYLAGLLCLAAALVAGINPMRAYSASDVALVLGLGLVPTVLGHSILNYALKHLRGQVVSIVNMGQFAFAGAMAYFLLGEVPKLAFYPACALLVLGCILAVRSTPARPT